MLRIREAIVVEGRYDKNTLSQLVDTLIVETNGFGIFKNAEQMELLRQLATRRGLIVFTDPDGAGFLIRNRIKSAVDPTLLKHAYVPDIMGKERRKAKPGKEGKLGVEGMERGLLEQALLHAGATVLGEQERAVCDLALSKADLMQMGISGTPDSLGRRKALLRSLGLPEHMSANALLQYLNSCCTRQELDEALKKAEI